MRTSPALSSPLPPAATNTPIAFAIGPGDDIVADLQNLATESAFPINLEVIHNYRQRATLVIPGFLLPSGTYRLDDILARLASASRAVTWQADGQSVNVLITLSQNVNNPFDFRLKAPVAQSATPTNWVWKLNSVDPTADFNLEVSMPGAIQQQPGAVTPVSVNIPVGETLRQALDLICEKAGLHWTAFVEDKAPYSVYYIQRGQRVTLYRLNNTVGRTRIWLFDLMPTN